MKNYLEIGKIVRAHGIKGAVKVVSFLDNYNFSKFKEVYLGLNKLPAKITKCCALNNNAFSLTLDIIASVEETSKYLNNLVFIDRDVYPAFENKIYFSDLINKPIKTPSGEELGLMVDFDDYGASVVLTIKCGVNSFQIPYVADVITYDRVSECFVIDKQKFDDLKV